jgi:hypothetical protein
VLNDTIQIQMTPFGRITLQISLSLVESGGLDDTPKMGGLMTPCGQLTPAVSFLE